MSSIDERVIKCVNELLLTGVTEETEKQVRELANGYINGDKIIFTSYYAKYEGSRGIAISQKRVGNYNRLEQLAPSWSMIKLAKSGYDYLYIIQYLYQLDQLGSEFFDQLPLLSTYLCFEKPDKFCHRHILAKYLKEKYNYIVIEI